jgi:hypothetical protein
MIGIRRASETFLAWYDPGNRLFQPDTITMLL